MENKRKHEKDKATIIALEKQALELWNNGNPDGFIELSSDDVIYFDPVFENKLEGKKALEDYYNPIRGKIKIDLYKMINPVVQLSSEVAVLAYNYEAHRDSMIFKMNCTEVYRLNSSNQWKIIHTHWSFVQPNKISTGMSDGSKQENV
jgi:ketosteroid isomerase-like protein